MFGARRVAVLADHGKKRDSLRQCSVHDKPGDGFNQLRIERPVLVQICSQVGLAICRSIFEYMVHFRQNYQQSGGKGSFKFADILKAYLQIGTTLDKKDGYFHSLYLKRRVILKPGNKVGLDGGRKEGRPGGPLFNLRFQAVACRKTIQKNR